MQKDVLSTMGNGRLGQLVRPMMLGLGSDALDPLPPQSRPWLEPSVAFRGMELLTCYKALAARSLRRSHASRRLEEAMLDGRITGSERATALARRTIPARQQH